jgi:hypothetical protein
MLSNSAEPLSEIEFLKFSSATFRLVLSFSFTKHFSFVTLVSNSRKLVRQFTGVIGFRKVNVVTSVNLFFLSKNFKLSVGDSADLFFPRTFTGGMYFVPELFYLRGPIGFASLASTLVLLSMNSDWVHSKNKFPAILSDNTQVLVNCG